MFEECLRRMPTLALQNDEPLPVRPANFIAGFEAMPVRV
jgi:cytochrome P450 family 142 subfamily A polypeptide 1